MAVQSIFKRYELKYLLTPAQYQAVVQAVESHMQPDAYHESHIRNLYFDTPDFRLVRRSLEGPFYKEKLRLRCYGTAGATDTVFAELKKKFDGVVYKRRESLPEAAAMDWLTGTAPGPGTQIGREITYARQLYPGLMPRMFLSYDRRAWAAGDLRITFDSNIRWRTDRLSLREPADGEPLLAPGLTLMEIKCSAAYPLWLAALLSREQIYKTTFSKYGRAYLSLCRQTEGVTTHV